MFNGTIQSTKPSIIYFLEDDEIEGPNCRIKVINPDSHEYDVDQPAPNIEIPLFLHNDTSSIESQLRIQWSDKNYDRIINDEDILELTTLSDNGLDSGNWYLKLVSKNGGEVVYLSGVIKVP